MNCRNALVAGMAVGLDIPLLLLAEDDYAAPFDYEDQLVVYDSAAACVKAARKWMDRLQVEGVRVRSGTRTRRSMISGLRLGEHVAENELADLSDYFVPTSAYNDVLRARDTLFVGHRGTGKTANAIQAFEELSSNKQNFTLLIKPSGFEFPGLLAAVDRLPEHTHDYLFDSLWRFLIQTELAAAALTKIEDKPRYVPRTEGESALVEYASRAPFDIRADLSVRLDQALSFLMERLPENSTVEAGRNLINEALHSAALVDLRHVLGPVLREKKRVAVFIDNLDKGWQRGANLTLLARLILGLLSARGHLVTDFARQDWWREEVRLTIAVFLRSDIFTYVKREAREPDKLSISAIAWRDTETLFTMLTERVAHSWSESGDPPDLWGEVFCDRVRNTPTAEYMVSLVLPRPRDLVYVCNAAIARAVDRGHDRVQEEDVLAAEQTYSQYAHEALLVENGITIPEMQEILFGFLGAPAILTDEVLRASLQETSLQCDRLDDIVHRLLEMSFLGLEVGEDRFVYPEVGSDLEKALAQAKRYRADRAAWRYQIHPAYRAFLEVEP